ncbi:hypothetical protein ABI59_10280 [Acidobacteria bacterium Mor1]|nr:hypothetical protein ABI59_10280 [Acidobacteria bacterium Mor1]
MAATLALATAPILAEEAPDPSGIDWPGFMGPAGDGHSPETGVTWPEEGLPKLWDVEAGEGYGGPSLADGRLFFFDRVEDQARLRAFDAVTGELLWTSTYKTRYEDLYQFSNGPRATPVVDGDLVYTFGVEGMLRASRVTDGGRMWEIDTTKTYGVVQNFFGVGSTPVIEGDLLIVPVGGSPKDSPAVSSGRVKGSGSGIVAFDKKTGKEKWRSTDELASYSSPVIRDVGDQRVGFYFGRRGLVTFKPETGKELAFFPWRAAKLESVNAMNPVVVDDKVFLSESYGPGGVVLSVSPGKLIPARKDKGRRGNLRTHWATPIYHEGYLYGCSGSSAGDAKLVAVNFETGELAWEKPGLTRTTMIYADGHLVVLAEDGTLMLVEATPEAFKLKGSMRLTGEGDSMLIKSPAWAPPVLSYGIVYVRGKDRLAAYELIPWTGEE